MTHLAIYETVAHIRATVGDIAALVPDDIELDAAWRLADERGEEIAGLRRLVAELLAERTKLRSQLVEARSALAYERGVGS